MLLHPLNPAWWSDSPLIKGRSTTNRAFYISSGKRLMDVVCSSLALLLTFPVFILIAIAVRLSSPGPVLFRQKRVGKGGMVFDILKFRSMVVDAPECGPEITRSGDQRVTGVGAILRRTKLDELPQLWNVIRGDMSLVGPRPETPRYVAMYTDDQRQVLSVLPGLTDPASITYRHEEAVLGRETDPERFYIEYLMPHKLALNRQYLSNVSLRNDVRLIWRTVRAIFRASADTGRGV